MSQIKPKQINSTGQTNGAVITTDGNGVNTWAIPTGTTALVGTPDDGSLTDARYTGGKAPAVPLTSTTKIATALDSLNEVLGLLLPNAPAPLSTGVLALSTASSTALAASGYVTNSVANAPAAGSTVTRVTAATVSTATLQDLGDGAEGTVALFEQGAAVTGETFAFTANPGDTKTTGVLIIGDNKWGGTANGGGTAPDGFFQTFDSTISGAPAVVGLNSLQLQHTISGNTNVLQYVRDDLTANPVVSAVTVAEGTITSAFSSGVKHYGMNSTLIVGGHATNLAGETYKSGTILAISGPGATVPFAAGQGGLAAILAKDTLAFDMANQTFTVNGNVQTTTGAVTLAVSNLNGTGSASAPTKLLVLSGTGGIADATITGPATTNRVVMTTNNVDTPSSLANTAWNSSTVLSGATNYEAINAGGVIRSDVTNYSTGYLPAGNPDYSTKPTTQYVTYAFALASKSSVTVNITGTYAGMWVALPGVSDNAGTSPNAVNGAWWNGSALYNGAGVPGRAGDTAAGAASGTAATGGNGSTVLSFGTQSSSNSTGNVVLVRIKLTAGQSISAISLA